LPVHCYDLFKGIAMEYINLQRTIKLQVNDLNIECWEECKTFSFKEFPEFVFLAQEGFYERSEMIPMLRLKNLDGRHEQIMADYRNTFTKERLELKNIIAMLKERTLTLD